jgi:hypothetical protein
MVLIFGAIIAARSQNIRLVSVAGIIVGASIMGLSWLVLVKGDETFIIGMVLGMAIELLIIKKYGFLQELKSL